MVLDKYTYFNFITNILINMQLNCIINFFIYIKIGMFNLSLQLYFLLNILLKKTS